MTDAMPPIAIGHVKLVDQTIRGIGVLASGASGLEIAGTLGGILGTIVAIIALTLSVITSNARKRRDYERDIREAEERGAARVQDDLDRMERDRDYWRAAATDANRPRAITRPIQRHVPDDSEDD